MQISEFQEWARGRTAINPLLKKEREVTLDKPEEGEETGRTIYVYVFPSGRVVRVYCDKEDKIVEVSGEEEALLM